MPSLKPTRALRAIETSHLSAHNSAALTLTPRPCSRSADGCDFLGHGGRLSLTLDPCNSASVSISSSSEYIIMQFSSLRCLRRLLCIVLIMITYIILLVEQFYLTRNEKFLRPEWYLQNMAHLSSRRTLAPAMGAGKLTRAHKIQCEIDLLSFDPNETVETKVMYLGLPSLRIEGVPRSWTLL